MVAKNISSNNKMTVEDIKSLIIAIEFPVINF